MVDAGRFREDFYYRIKVFEVHLPALRDRREDLPLLIEQFLTEFNSSEDGVPKLSPEAWKALHAYSFPGNVRELRHVIQHAPILARGEEIDLVHLPPEILGAQGAPPEDKTTSLAEAMQAYEKDVILRALHKTGKADRSPPGDLAQEPVEEADALWSADPPCSVTKQLNQTDRKALHRGFSDLNRVRRARRARLVSA